MANTKLSDAQLAALSYAATHKGFISNTRSGAARATLQSLVALGLLVFSGSSGWRHGEITRVQYRVTDTGRKVIRIGRMLRAFAL